MEKYKMELYEYFIEETIKKKFFKKEKLTNEYYVVNLNDTIHYFFRNQKENHLLVFIIDKMNFRNDYHRLATEEEKEYSFTHFKETVKTIQIKEIHNYKKYRHKNQNYLSTLIPHFLKKVGIKVYK
jgi:hypothetical protein